MGLTLLMPPPVEPVQLNEAKAHMRVTISNDDALIKTYLLAARYYVENYLERTLITTGWRLSFDAFPIYASTQLPFPFYQAVAQNTAYQSSAWSYLINPTYGVLPPPNYEKMTLPNWGNVPLPKPPLKAVTSITYIDANNIQQTWDSSQYQVITDNSPGYIRPIAAYPMVKAGLSDAVSINFTTGYGLCGDVPEPIKLAIKILAATWYENREANEVQAGIKQAVLSLLDTYRFYGIN